MKLLGLFSSRPPQCQSNRQVRLGSVTLSSQRTTESTTLENNQNINVREQEYYHHGRRNHHIGLSKRKRAQRRQKLGRSNISTLISAMGNRRAIFRTKTIHPRLRVCNQNWCEKQRAFNSIYLAKSSNHVLETSNLGNRQCTVAPYPIEKVSRRPKK